ncbi:MAG: hypothetical protein ACLQU1_17290 [Bryobacteraceae bacterium]
MTTKEHLERHDRQIAAIRDLVQQGMRLVLETRKDIRSLTAAQKRTDASLRAFIDGMRGGGNGHAKGKVDLR